MTTMTQLALFDATPTQTDPYAFDPDEIGGAIRPFVRFCKDRLGAKEGEIHLAIIIEDAWKTGRHHPYLKAWDSRTRSAS